MYGERYIYKGNYSSDIYNRSDVHILYIGERRLFDLGSELTLTRCRSIGFMMVPWKNSTVVKCRLNSPSSSRSGGFLNGYHKTIRVLFINNVHLSRGRAPFSLFFSFSFFFILDVYIVYIPLAGRRWSVTISLIRSNVNININRDLRACVLAVLTEWTERRMSCSETIFRMIDLGSRASAPQRRRARHGRV